MAIEITQIFIKLSADVPWFIDTLPASHIEYIRENYVATGKLTGSTTRVDDLTLKQTFTFTTLDDQEEFINDSNLIVRIENQTTDFIDSDQ
jgi:hypothetical protein